MLAIAIPVALQNLITSGLNMLDTMMITSLGDASIAAVGLANQIFFFYILICFGINSGSSVIMAQFWGKGSPESVRYATGIAVSLCVSVGLIFTLGAQYFPEVMMRWLTRDEQVVQIGSDYLKTVSYSYIITSVALALATAQRSTGLPNPPLYAAICGFFVNAIFNYLLIFGAFGFPKMGVVGAAWGTNIARLVELSLIVSFILYTQHPLRHDVRDWFKFDRKFAINMLIVLFPVVLNETMWSLGQVVYNASYAVTGVQSTAAVQVASSIQNMLFVIVRGLGTSCAIMIANAIGHQEVERAKQYGSQFLKLSFIVGAVLGGILAVTSPIILRLFGNLTPEVRLITQRLLWIMGIFHAVKSFNSVLVVGVLRGGGDVRFSMWLETLCVWLIGVPLSIVSARMLHFPVEIVMVLILLEEVVKMLVGMYRVKSQRWIHSMTE